MATDKYLTVSAINRYIAYKLDSDPALKIVYVKGEVSNARISKGHLYFVLKDEESEISAIIFANTLRNSNYVPSDGAKVLICGSITSYSKKGSYNLIVSSIQEFGQGLIYQEFLKLKAKLEAEGLFDQAHKKKIPEYPESVSVVTSETGDALQDIISTINRRYPITKIYLYKALVQGVDAPKSLIKALRQAESDKYGEVIIIARGGGSIEDLNCFNDEELARVIYDLSIPIVSGVGHEMDFTICDYVADDRAPTPTGAAVRVTPDKEIILNDLKNSKTKLVTYINRIYDNCNNSYLNLVNNYYFKSFDKVIGEKEKEVNHLIDKLDSVSPINVINKYDQELNNLVKRMDIYNLPKRIDDLTENINVRLNDLNKAYLKNITIYENEFVKRIDKLVLVNPLNIMKKGYTLIYKNDSLITSSNELNSNDEVDINFHDGKRQAIIK